MKSFEILGLGTALPEHSISQAGMATFATTCVAPELTGSKNPSGLIHALYRRAGVQSRHSVLLESSSDDEATAERFFEFVKGPEDRGPGTAERMNRFEIEAPKIAMKATDKAIKEAKIDPAEITHLITVSCSGFSAPGVDLHLIETLGLARSVARTHVGFMGCHGALNGLRVAHSFAAADPNAVIAMCASARCITSMAGIRSRSWQIPSSQTVLQQSSAEQPLAATAAHKSFLADLWTTIHSLFLTPAS